MNRNEELKQLCLELDEAVPGLDASAICKPFGGGGHKGAAGANLALPMESALKVVAAALERMLEEV